MLDEWSAWHSFIPILAIATMPQACIQRRLLLVMALLLAACQRAPSGASTEGMQWIPGGEFTMGAQNPIFADAYPPHRVRVSGFWLDTTEVTNAAFARFVDATGYRTIAERPLDLPGLAAEHRVAGSVVFDPPAGEVPLDQPSRWWHWVPGADWRHPEGPGSHLDGRMDHPVVHLAWDDVIAYAQWSGKRVPTEAEWEFAARGGLEGFEFTWGSQADADAGRRANLFQGRFPTVNAGIDGYLATAPAQAFPANGYGLYGMAGNVWEWVADWYRPDTYRMQLAADPEPLTDPTGPTSGWDPAEPGIAKRVQKGGSFLCTDQYCARFRPGARGKGAVDTGSNHLGMRLALDAPPPRK